MRVAQTFIIVRPLKSSWGLLRGKEKDDGEWERESELYKVDMIYVPVHLYVRRLCPFAEWIQQPTPLSFSILSLMFPPSFFFWMERNRKFFSLATYSRNWERGARCKCRPLRQRDFRLKFHFEERRRRMNRFAGLWWNPSEDGTRGKFLILCLF